MLCGHTWYTQTISSGIMLPWTFIQNRPPLLTAKYTFILQKTDLRNLSFMVAAKARFLPIRTLSTMWHVYMHVMGALPAMRRACVAVGLPTRYYAQCALPIMRHVGALPIMRQLDAHVMISLPTVHHVYMHAGAVLPTLHCVGMHVQDDRITLHHVDIDAWNLAIKSCARSGSWMTALHLFEQLQQEGLMPKKLTFTNVIVACASHGGLNDGKRMHARILASTYDSDHVIHTALVNMYGKHSRLDNASDVFDRMSNRDVVACSTIIAVYAQQGKGPKALQFYYQMLEEGVMPDKIAFVCIIDACIYTSKRERLWMYVHVMNSKLEDDVAVGTALVNMCGKCDTLDMAREVFDGMVLRNVLTWSAMISVHVQHAQGMKALQLFNDMQEQGVLPNEVTFISVVAASTSEENLGAGQRLHARIVGDVVKMDLSLGNSLLNFYNKCGTFEDAVSAFQTLSKLDVISFTAMIVASVRHGKADGAFGFLNRMISSGHMPDQVTFVSVLEACVIPSVFPATHCVHAFIIECGYDSDIILTNALLNIYCKHGDVLEAHWIFYKIAARDTISWNAIIDLHAQQEQLQDVLELFQQMQQETMLDKVTILNAIKSFMGHAALPCGKRLHTQVLANRLESDVSVGTGLVSMYGRCGSLTLAQRVFNELQDRDLILWTEMGMAFAHNGKAKDVKQLFDRLLLECFTPDQLCFVSFLSALCAEVVILEVKRMHVYLVNSPSISDITVNNALLDVYGKCGGLEDAQELFYRMSKRDLVSWNILLSIHNHHAQSQEVFYILDRMCWEGYFPDKVTWTSCLVACAGLINLAEGKRLHAYVRHNGFDTDGFVATALLNMYGKCGNLEAARRTFDALPVRTLVSWNTMIAVYAQHGLGEEALKLFDLMLLEKVLPDNATFASVLAACRHAGLLLEGCRILASMNNLGLCPSADDYSCIIDLLGRLGRLDEAENFINAQVTDATAKSCIALLSSCRHQTDIERGERVAKQILHLDSANAAAYVLLSNLYAHAIGSSGTVGLMAGV